VQLGTTWGTLNITLAPANPWPFESRMYPETLYLVCAETGAGEGKEENIMMEMIKTIANISSFFISNRQISKVIN
jgi:hypothetical protein